MKATREDHGARERDGVLRSPEMHRRGSFAHGRPDVPLRQGPSAAGASRSLTGETLVWQKEQAWGASKPPQNSGALLPTDPSPQELRRLPCAFPSQQRVQTLQTGTQVCTRARPHTRRCTPTHTHVRAGARPGSRVRTPIGTRACTHTLTPPALPSRGSVFSAAGLVRRCLPPPLWRTRSAQPTASPPTNKGPPPPDPGFSQPVVPSSAHGKN